jgi:16S rRNA (uracil1498-N3)-methyltransferase
MNLVLLSETEAESGVIPEGDARAQHLLKVVGVKVGGSFFVGVANGLRGKATILDTNAGIRFSVEWETAVQEKLPLVFVVGLPRPQTAKKVLFELTALGASGIHFFKSEKGDPAYATATLWRDEEWRDEVARGAEQAFTTLLPEVSVHASLAAAIEAAGAVASLPAGYAKVAPDVYEAAGPLGAPMFSGKSGALIAIGPERGWSERERDVLKKVGFTLAHLGDRVLRVETACVAAGAVALSGMGCWRGHRS